jgi:hypothetical protein
VRDVAGRVDDGVPAPAVECREVARPVAEQMIGLGEEVGVRLPAREDRRLVPAPERRPDDGAPEELRPAEN